MSIARGRILRGPSSTSAEPIGVKTGGELPFGRVEKAEIVDVRERAGRILDEAAAQAKAIVSRAEEQAAELRAKAVDEGRAVGEAQLAGAWMRLRVEDGARAQRDLDQTVALARLLAERILGEALAVDPTRITAIARQALAQARRARRILIVANPDDAVVLAREKATLGLEQAEIELQADPSLSRGSLRLRTDLGNLDADLSPQLDRLVTALRDGLRAG